MNKQKHLIENIKHLIDKGPTLPPAIFDGRDHALPWAVPGRLGTQMFNGLKGGPLQQDITSWRRRLHCGILRFLHTT